MRSVCAVALAATIGLVSSASAATVRVTPWSAGDPTERQVLIEDSGGEANTLELRYVYTYDATMGVRDGVVTVHDETAPLVAGEGCTQGSDGDVRCEVEDLRLIEALLGAGVDRATAHSPDGVSCACVSIAGGADNDSLTSHDGSRLTGDDGNDVLRGLPSTASSSAGFLPGEVESDVLSGGDGDDVLDGGEGPDGLFGGAGDDTLRGGAHDDDLTGGGPGAAGRDHLSGDDGDDELNDGDGGAEPGDVGPDILIGGRGFDTVFSYWNEINSARDRRVVVDLSEPAEDGEAGEGDSLVNVERVWGGEADDQLFGDGDSNSLDGFGGENYLRGGGGGDALIAEAAARHRVHGDRGSDRIRTTPWARGPFYCGTGNDTVEMPAFGPNAGSYPDRTRNLGPVLASNCETLTQARLSRCALDPQPRLKGRTLIFKRRTYARYQKECYLTVTYGTKPFKKVGRSILERGETEVRVFRWIARRAAKRKVLLRAEMGREGYEFTNMVWRYRFGR